MNTLILKYIDFGSGFWSVERKLSGRKIDEIRGQNIPFNSKAIDRTIGLNRIISHKSTDIRLKSYRTSGQLYRLGMRFIKQLKTYKGEIRMDHKIGATYNLHWALEGPDACRVLEWFIPETTLNEEHEHALIKISKAGAESGIIVELYLVKDY